MKSFWVLSLSVALLATACGDTNKASGVQDVTTQDVTTQDVTMQDVTTQDVTSGSDADSQEPLDLDLTSDGVTNDVPVDTAQSDTSSADTQVETDTSQADASEVDTQPTNPLYVGQGDVYSQGSLAVSSISVASGEQGAPTSMLIFAPVAAGDYAVVVFQHGFILQNQYYSNILTHLASHGFVVVAPQMYAADGLPFGKPTSTEEAALAVEVLDWLPTHLNALSGVEARLDHLGLAGHSRGGKVAWTILKGAPTRMLAIAGVDPVDGTGGPLGGEARIVNGTFPTGVPALVIGTELGPVSSGIFQPACAPEGDNHEQFYGASPSPAWHVLALAHGHNDVLDDNPAGCGLTCTVCPGGDNRAGLRSLVAGLLVALFRLELQGDAQAAAILTQSTGTPIGVTMESR